MTSQDIYQRPTTRCSVGLHGQYTTQGPSSYISKTLQPLRKAHISSGIFRTAHLHPGHRKLPRVSAASSRIDSRSFRGRGKSSRVGAYSEHSPRSCLLQREADSGARIFADVMQSSGKDNGSDVASMVQRTAAVYDVLGYASGEPLCWQTRRTLMGYFGGDREPDGTYFHGGYFVGEPLY